MGIPQTTKATYQPFRKLGRGAMFFTGTTSAATGPYIKRSTSTVLTANVAPQSHPNGTTFGSPLSTYVLLIPDWAVRQTSPGF